jgi:hypothetical protein
VFGDSYSTPNYCVDIKDSFWHKVAMEVNASTVYNYSWVGNSLDSIFHILVSEQESFDWNGLFLIGLPILERLTYFDNHLDTMQQVSVIENGTIIKKDILSHSGLVQDSWHESSRDLVMFEDRDWTEAYTLRNLFLLDTWLRTKTKNYMFINLFKGFMNDTSWPTRTFVTEYFLKHTNSIIFNKTYLDINQGVHKPVDYDQYGWQGHHGASGNENFYTNSVKPTMLAVGLLCN